MDQESLPALISRYVQLKANGKGFVGRCVFHTDEGESLRVDEKSWRCLQCGAHDGQADAAGWLMAWSQCSREDAEHQLSNGGLPEVIPIQVPPLKKLPFWGDWALHKMPDARIWVHDSYDGVHAGREFFPERVHLGVIYKADLTDVSQLCQPKLRECIFLPRHVESSMERMDALAAALYAAGHVKVRWIDPRSREDNWSWPLGMGKDEAVAFAKKHVLTYPNGLMAQPGLERLPVTEEIAGSNPAQSAINAAPAPAPVSPSSSHGLDRGAASDTPKDSLGPRLERKRPGNGQGGPPLAPEHADAYTQAAKALVLSGIIYRKASSIRMRATDWLWPGKIPSGEICVIQGDPGLGKSQITASICAIVTKGGTWPVTRERCDSGSVILLSAEDSAAKTIRPRLQAAGADLDKVIILQAMKNERGDGTRGFSLVADVAALGVLLGEMDNPKLVIIDPVSAYQDAVGGKTPMDSHKNTDVRSLLRPLSELVERRNLTMILINHLTKAGGRAIARGQGNMAFVAGPRAVWQVSKDKEDKRKRLFLPVKNNLADDSEETGLSFGVESVDLGLDDEGKPIKTSRILWNDERVTISADEASGYDALSHEERGGITDAREFLTEALSEGRLKVKDVERMAKMAGHSLTTIGRAKRAMGILSEKEGFAADTIWYWRLNEPPRNWVKDD